MLGSQLWQRFTHYTAAFQAVFGSGEIPNTSPDFPSFGFLQEWKVLGPFQIGTREATWGADPLEHYGGFHALQYNATATFRSSLTFNGTTGWTNTSAKLSGPGSSKYASVDLHVDFPQINWPFLQDVYGWAALQWQGWARGEFMVVGDDMQTMALHAEHILELWIDDEHHFGGDFYAYGRAPITLHLHPGVHRLDVRLVRDVRAMGGVGEPTVDVKLRLEASEGCLSPVLPDNSYPYQGVLMSDPVGSIYSPVATSPYGSVTVRNDALTDIFIFDLIPTRDRCEAELVGPTPIKLVPGQTRPLPFRLACVSPMNGRGPVDLEFHYRVEGENNARVLTYMTWPDPIRDLYAPQKVTYLHPGGIVSYMILRPPSVNAQCAQTNRSVPVMLAFHGAGLEADSNFVREQLDPLPDLCAWVVFPTGVTPWSGDDWHQWGFADVEAAIAAIPDWIETVEWQGPGVDMDRWFVVGHSNGGQGVWYALTHRPDKIIAAAPLSGYSSIQNYVPYTLWHNTDPDKMAVVQSALNTYRHELLLENAKGIPILQQHGEDDDNVPAYHSRLLSQLNEQSGVQSTYSEVPEQGHWWEGVITTTPLRNFYQKHLNGQPENRTLEYPDFTVVSAGHGDMGTKHGVEILRLITPGRLGKVHISFNSISLGCSIRTSNVQTFRLPSLFGHCAFFVVDHDKIPLSTETLLTTWDLTGSGWVQNLSLPPLPQRHGRQLGAMDAILRTDGPFNVVITTETSVVKATALQISRNLCQYFAADTLITSDHKTALIGSAGNIITIAVGSSIHPDRMSYDYPNYPIRTYGDRIQITDIDGSRRTYYNSKGLAAVFLRPLPAGRLELVVWAATEGTLGLAARLVPMLTGTGQPDFVIVDASASMTGLDGALALGYLGSKWEVSRNSYST